MRRCLPIAVVAVGLFACSFGAIVGCASHTPMHEREYAAGPADEAPRDRATRLMEQVPLIDGHNDLPWQYRGRVDNHVAELDISQDLTGVLERPTHTDLPRLREGRVGAQFWSVYIPIRNAGGAEGDARTVLEQIDLVHRLCDAYPDDLEIALTADDVERIFDEGKIPSLMGMEGGHSMENSLAVLRQLYVAGARYMTLTHSLGTLWADSGTDEARVGGLSAFGEEVVREMNRMGMLVDIAHTSPETMHDALDVTVAPVIFSHASARAVCDHPRNVPDDVLGRLPENGGVVMITFVPNYISSELNEHAERRREARRQLQEEYADDPTSLAAALREWDQRYPAPVATLSQVADHIDHVKSVAGADHVGIGGDYDGIRSVPEGLEDVSTYPDLIAELCRRGWTDDEIRRLLGLNVLRVMRECEAVALRLQAERPASDKTIQELDGIDPWGS